MKKSVWIAAGTVVLLVAAGGGWWAAKNGALKASSAKAAEGKGADQKPADITLMLAAADVAVAGPATLTQSLAVAGTVDAARQAIVRSRHAGFLTQVSKRAGDAVQSRERLGVVDSDELRLRIVERESTLKQTQAALTVAESSRTQQRSLADRGFISKAALDSADSNYVAARSAFDAAKTNLDIARAALAETALIAPLSGVIAKRSVEPGERVGGEMAVFTILDPTSLEVVVPIAAERVAELKTGQKASFQLDAGGNAVEGTLTRIIPTTGSAARTVETRFALPAATTVPAGAFLSGHLRLSQRTVPIAVPRIAMKTDVNGSYVWTVQDGKATQRRVKFAPSAGETNALVPVADGLAAGSTVLTLRGTEPVEGQKVALPGSTPPAAPTASTVSNSK
ncbi:MAG: efflux RND transporter periplasmic adaptor subunit [Burkholderiales bacterium]|nr:efflux RND transporter periplasmic adaptor subunit [Burkholderiales bacterium]